MVKIKRDSHEIKVSEKSFKAIFEPLGYTLVKAQKVKEPKKVENSKKVEEPKKIDK